ncbi:PTS transporter subunit IIC [Listeria fleischmannii]|uniref:PTS transporter subunit IIC n=1 Tax=Listeria fleischmannii TaxID=1069827 RepID=UPI00162AA05E|nr:PTS sugar transporter subunit IIC [Listeria fleischmannii]MBC1418673.1 PTS transporter subunit IIC [Listeria fleischmannii]
MKEYFIDRSYKASMGIANAVLVTLGMGLLLQTIGNLVGLDFLVKIGAIGKNMLIPGLGIGIAICLRANTLVVISAAASAVIGGGGILALENGGFAIAGGEPVGAILAVLVAVWTGKRVSGKTKFDMIVIPGVSLLAGGLSGILFAKIMTPILVTASGFITSLVSGSPIISSMVIAAVFGLLILSPASSAALAIALQLDPTASAAALIGCSVQFASFAILSFRDNNWGGFFAQLIITPKLQTANIIRKPSLMLIPLLTALVAGPIGVLVFNLQATAEIAGMGLCAFVAPLYLIANYGIETFLAFVLVAVIFPAAVALIVRPILLRNEKLKTGDLKIELE